MNQNKRLVVLISGNGSNLQAMIDQIHTQDINASIVAVISNVKDAFGLERARKAGLDAIALTHDSFKDRNEYNIALQERIDSYSPDLIILAGYMRILPKEMVQHFANKIINIHPSLLPKYPGLNTHQRALEAGDSEHGCTIHLVTEELDGGPIIAQKKLQIETNDIEESLRQKIHILEHQLYPETIIKICSGDIHLNQLK